MANKKIPLKIFDALYTATSNVYQKLREIAFSPNQNKELLKWGITDAAKMVGRTPQRIRALEENGELPKPEVIKKGRREDRIYSLAHINKLRDHFGTRPSKPQGEKAKVVAFANFKGGAAKTISAVNFAQCMALKGYKVCLADADSQGSATQLFGLIPDEDLTVDETLYNILNEEHGDIRRVIKKTYWDNLDIIPANLGLYGVEFSVPAQIVSNRMEEGTLIDFYNRLNRSLETVKDDYDIIIIDCPPSLGIISINALYAADSILVPMPPNVIDFASTKQFFQMISETMGQLPEKQFGFVKLFISKHNKRSSASDILQLCKAFLGDSVLNSFMVDSEAVTKAAGNMQTIYEYNNFVNDKKTFIRAKEMSTALNEEIEELIKLYWSNKLNTVEPQILRAA